MVGWWRGVCLGAGFLLATGCTPDWDALDPSQGGAGGDARGGSAVGGAAAGGSAGAAASGGGGGGSGGAGAASTGGAGGVGLCVSACPDGEPCSDASACTSGFCVDGVCCESACDAVCVTCNRSQASAGSCRDVPRQAEDPGVCEGAEACDGSGACLAANGEACSASSECASGFCANDNTCKVNDNQQ